MLNAIDAGKFDVVVSVNFDRLLRGLSDLTTLIDKGALILTVDGEIDLTSAEGEFQATLLASLARFETKRKSERQLRANDAKSAKGIPVPTRRRYGYETDGRTLIPAEAAIVRELFDRFTTGASIRSLSMDLIARSIPFGGGKGWPPNRVRAILGNPFYAGKVVHRGVVSESEVVEPAVSEQTFEAAKAILDDPSRRTSPGSEIRHLLSGIAVCGVCGANMNFTTGYKCSLRNDHVFIKKEYLESVVLDWVSIWFFENRDADWLKVDDESTRELLTESAKLTKEIVHNTTLMTDPLVDVSTVRKRLRKLNLERDAIESKVGAQFSKSAQSKSLESVQAFWRQPVDWGEFEDLRESGSSFFFDSDGKPLKLDEDNFEWMSQDYRLLENWRDVWDELGLDLQRDLMKSLFSVTVNKGRTSSRIEILAKPFVASS
ncbi:MAG: recombinase family protein [Actinobacteria bacterium]|nr:recombinase family protein [Actinomycetota bacterium]